MLADRPPAFATLAVLGGGDARANGAIEARLAALEGGTAAVAVCSSHVLLSALRPLMRPGDQAIVAEGVADALRDGGHGLGSFGWEIRWADGEPASFERLIGPRTQIIVAPVLAASGAVTDLDAISRLARQAGVPLAVDNTLATPALCRPFDFGADIVLHGDSRFLCGNATATGFIVDGGRFNWLASGRYPVFSARREGDGVPLAEAVGNYAYAAACQELNGQAAISDRAMVAAGIETLPLRMARHAATARAVATYLAGHRRVATVAYAGAAGDRYHALAERYCPAGSGAVVTFAPDGGSGAAAAFLEGLGMIAAEPQVSTARSSVVSWGKTGRLRLSVGLEDADDLIADLDAALAIA